MVIIAWQLVKQSLEIRRACSQHDFVTLDRPTVIDSKGDIGECRVVQQLLEDIQQVRAMIVPSEAVLLRSRHDVQGGVSLSSASNLWQTHSLFTIQSNARLQLD